MATVRQYGVGEILFSEGARAELLHLVVAGRVKLTKTTASGRAVILKIAGPGDPVGALASDEDDRFVASARAVHDTTCVLIPRRVLFALLVRDSSLAVNVLHGLTRLVAELTCRTTELIGGRVEERFARLFLRLAEDTGREDADGLRIPLALSRQDLADLTGTSVETCIRIMTRWNREHIVCTEKCGFLVTDLRALEARVRPRHFSLADQNLQDLPADHGEPVVGHA